MRRFPFRSVSICVHLWLIIGLAADNPATLREATTILQTGDFKATEQFLNTALKTNPNQPAALSLLAVALDFQQRPQEAAQAHIKAITQAPNTPDILANYGNHLLSVGNPTQAKIMFLRATAADPIHLGANRQLAQLALQNKDPREALTYLNRIPPQASTTDFSYHFTLGLTHAALKQSAEAEKSFAKALELDPTNINVQINLALAATQAGHVEKALEVLTAAKAQSPDHTEIQYRLAWVNTQLGRHEEAIKLLSQLIQQAPKHADTLRLLAITTSELRAFADSANAWDRYLAVVPQDATARRERGFANFLNGEVQKGLTDLQWYAQQRPQDPTGLYQLALAEGVDNPAKALNRLNAALAIKPDFTAARSERGSLHYQAGRFRQAQLDLELAAKQQPNDPYTLDRLGQTYASLNRPADALAVLRKAAQLAPENSTIVLHLGRALATSGLTAESAATMERFRQLGPPKNKPVPDGFVTYLGLTPEQRQADYRARVEQSIKDSPNDPEANLRHLKMLLEQGSDPTQPAQTLLTIKPDAQVLEEAGAALLDARKFALAKAVLKRAADTKPSTQLTIQLAQAAFQTEGSPSALLLLETIPIRERKAAFFLARAEMQPPSEAEQSVQTALELVPLTPDDYRRAVAIFVKTNNRNEAELTATLAAANLPKSREALLLKAATLAWTGKTAAAEELLTTIRATWPATKATALPTLLATPTATW